MVYTEDEVKAWGDGLCPERYMTKDCQFVLVAEIDSCGVGFGTLDCSTGEITGMFILPAYVRQGIGTCILNALLTEAHRIGLSQVWCQSSLFAEAFYQKAGFQSGQKGKHQFRSGQKIDYIPMSKSLV